MCALVGIFLLARMRVNKLYTRGWGSEQFQQGADRRSDSRGFFPRLASGPYIPRSEVFSVASVRRVLLKSYERLARNEYQVVGPEDVRHQSTGGNEMWVAGEGCSDINAAFCQLHVNKL